MRVRLYGPDHEMLLDTEPVSITMRLLVRIDILINLPEGFRHEIAEFELYDGERSIVVQQSLGMTPEVYPAEEDDVLQISWELRWGEIEDCEAPEELPKVLIASGSSWTDGTMPGGNDVNV